MHATAFGTTGRRLTGLDKLDRLEATRGRVATKKLGCFVCLFGLALAASACGPDPYIGTYSYTSTSTITLVSNDPDQSPYTTTGTGSGTLTVTPRSTSDYVVSWSGSSCAFNANRARHNSIDFPPNQLCTVSGGTSTITLTNGSGAFEGNVLRLTLNFNVRGFESDISYTGTIAIMFSCTRR